MNEETCQKKGTPKGKKTSTEAHDKVNGLSEKEKNVMQSTSCKVTRLRGNLNLSTLS